MISVPMQPKPAKAEQAAYDAAEAARCIASDKYGVDWVAWNVAHKALVDAKCEVDNASFGGDVAAVRSGEDVLRVARANEKVALDAMRLSQYKAGKAAKAAQDALDVLNRAKWK